MSSSLIEMDTTSGPEVRVLRCVCVAVKRVGVGWHSMVDAPVASGQYSRACVIVCKSCHKTMITPMSCIVFAAQRRGYMTGEIWLSLKLTRQERCGADRRRFSRAWSIEVLRATN